MKVISWNNWEHVGQYSFCAHFKDTCVFNHKSVIHADKNTIMNKDTQF